MKSVNKFDKKRDVLRNLNVDIRERLAEVGRVTDLLGIDQFNLNQSRSLAPVISLKFQPKKNQVYTSNQVKSRKNISNNTVILKQKPRKLRPYDPLYTWNRGGRLKELRIRCQARKYLHIWIRKCLGRVTELQAAIFHRRQILKKYWKTWFDKYWLLRIEPRLLGKAILYRKSIVLRSTLLAWKWWTKLRALQRVKMEIAVRYSENNLKKSSLNIWMSWNFVNKCKMKLRLTSEKWMYTHTTEHFFNVWKQELFIQREIKVKMSVALKHYRIIMISKVWQQWIEIRPQLRRKNIGNVSALSFCRHRLLKKSLDSWLQYHQSYRRKRKELDKLQDYYNWNLARRFLQTWREQYIRSLTATMEDLRINDLAKRCNLRKTFLAWKFYVFKRKTERKSEYTADQFYRKTLMNKMWSNMLKYAWSERVKTDKRCQAVKFNDAITLRRSLHRWSDMLEYKDDQERRMELGAARAHYRYNDCSLNRTTLIKCFHNFSKYIDQLKVKKDREKVADIFRHGRVLKRTMSAWFQYFCIQKRKKEMIKIKTEYLKEHVIKKIWCFWQSETRQRLIAKDNYNRFVEEKVISEKKKILHIWRCSAIKKIRKNNNLDIASQHYRAKLLRKGLNAMITFVEQEEIKRNIYEKTDNLRNVHLLKHSFCALHENAIRKKNAKSLVTANICLKKDKVKRDTFKIWRMMVEDSRLRKFIAEDLFQNKIKEVLRKKFEQWRKFTKVRQKKRDKTYKTVLLLKEQINERLRLKFFEFWKQKTFQRIEVSNKCIMAEQFCELKMLTKSLISWKNHTNERHEKSLKKEQALWFSQKSHMTKAWLTWTNLLVDRQREQYYTKYALVHWASKLQLKVLSGLIQYKNDRKLKNERKSEAYDIFQRRVRRYTLRQWLSSADFLCSWRESQSRLCPNSSSLISRAFAHWRQWTINRTSKKRVTSIEITESHISLPRPRIKVLDQQRKCKHRSAPKIPDFLLKPLSGKSLLQTADVDVVKGFIPCRNSNSCENDDVLLPPSSFFNSKTQKYQVRPMKQEVLVEELSSIKARLVRFKETKQSLKQLRDDLHEYDKVLVNLSLDNDSSFYQEFNPTGYREELLCHILEMERVLENELPICSELAKRAKNIVSELN